MVETQYFERPNTVVVKGEQAVAVLNEFINELQKGQAEELTQKQTDAMIKLTKGLISTIESETQTPPKKLVSFLPQIKCKIEKFLPPLIEQIKQLDIPTQADSKSNLHHPPLPHIHSTNLAYKDARSIKMLKRIYGKANL